MNDVTLKQLLRRADTSPTPTAPADFTATLLARRATQTRRTVTTAVALLLAIAAGAFFYSDRRPATAPPPVAQVVPSPPPDPAPWLALADRMEAAARLARARRSLYQSHSAIAAERERTAALLVAQGDWLRRHGSDPTPDYRRAAELFADTRAATVARAKLRPG